MSKNKFYRTVVQVEVLSEGPYNFESLSGLVYDITKGDCSGQVLEPTKSTAVSPKEMARLLIEQGSDPGFFSLDEDGNELDEDFKQF